MINIVQSLKKTSKTIICLTFCTCNWRNIVSAYIKTTCQKGERVCAPIRQPVRVETWTEATCERGHMQKGKSLSLATSKCICHRTRGYRHSDCCLILRTKKTNLSDRTQELRQVSLVLNKGCIIPPNAWRSRNSEIKTYY